MGGWVGISGSMGRDWSVNPASLGGLNLLQTIPANTKRNAVGVQNQSTNLITVARDDGTGAQVTVLQLGPAPSTGQEGGDYVSQTFKGEIRIYGLAGSQVAAWED